MMVGLVGPLVALVFVIALGSCSEHFELLTFLAIIVRAWRNSNSLATVTLVTLHYMLHRSTQQAR